MKKAVIYYSSRTGTTKYFANAIAGFLRSKNVETFVFSIYDMHSVQINGADYVFLGCWAHGLFVAFQHPNSDWVQFAQKLPGLSDKKVALFTTYKLATGSMFKKMKMHLKGKTDGAALCLKSRNTKLTEGHKTQIADFLGQGN
ncbi:MAG: flavodoxin family protein [Bacteroidales bacterium]|nr:flavodoxin family protein [Bacteroidales bacterium]